MKETFFQLSAYNIWANQLLLDVVNQLPGEKQTQTVVSSFDSLLKTVLHVWDAESIWWQRMKLSEKIIRPSENFNGTMKEAIKGLLEQNKMWNEWVAAAQEHMLQHVFIYQNTKKEQFKQPVYQMLLHVFNHGTYHRGQLVTMLRQLGVEKIPATDFIVWSRKK
ncbi:MAG: DinB family protein [Flavisolibacter sp.]|jgi:uncharacterized damage-inducible protein DinB